MSTWEEAYKDKLILPNNLIEKVTELRNYRQTIATLNGSFDLLHAGHLQIIYEASRQADILILALNSDASIKIYKSLDRPLIPLQERLQLVAALGFVDYVTYFGESDPRVFLGKVKPDVHVNGSEYGDDCIEAETIKKHGGRIHIVPLIPGQSTTQIIEKIKTTCV